MVFGGLQKNSLIDYPGKVSCVLFLCGCNFDCPYCHNPGLVKCTQPSSSVDDDGVYDFLESRRGFLDGVVVSGGEPTLQKGLAALCDKIKRMGFPVKLDTNGSRPQVIAHLIDEGLVDYLAMDIKTEPLNYTKYIKGGIDPDDLLTSIQIIMQSALSYEFRTTCVKPMVDVRMVENIAKIIKGARLYALQHFNSAELLHPEFFQGMEANYDEEELLYLKSIADPWVKDCIVR